MAESPELETLLSVYFLSRAALPANEEITHENLDKSAFAAFQILCAEWPKKGEDWSDISETLWSELTEAFISNLDPGFLREVSSPDEKLLLDQYLGANRVIPTLPRFARSCLDAMSSTARRRGIEELISDIRRGAGEYYSRMRLMQTANRSTHARDALYVDREIRVRIGDERESRPSSDLTRTGIPAPRTVVIGDPGIGKSTLVGHVMYSLANNSEDGRAPLLVRCRDLGISVEEDLIRLIAVNVGADLQLPIDHTTLEDTLATGRAIVVFDGLDEVTEPTRKQRLSQSIEMFAHRFPLTGIIVTTRRVGFKRSDLNDRMFKIAELDEYSNEQLHEYVSRWFTLEGTQGNSSLHFLRESESIDDIRRNPLMLSLLCSLYEDQGWIPRNRRDVYHDCALLLFRRWDSMRHVRMPVDHQEHGIQLMRDLGYFFFSQPTAASGIERSQLKKLIRNFFIDTGGSQEDAADERAESFLQYCSDRAWLLSDRGTNAHGQRLFGFTHRTFQEYFAAEALVRQEKDVKSLARRLIKLHSGDESSVMPELIVQCYNEVANRGAEELVTSLVSPDIARGTGNAPATTTLLLRIISSAPVGPLLVKRILSRYFSSLQSQSATDDGADDAFFGLYRDPRAWAHRMLTEDIQTGELGWNVDYSRVRPQVLANWASRVLVGDAAFIEPEWHVLMASVRKLSEERGEPKYIQSRLLELENEGSTPATTETIELLPAVLFLTIDDIPEPSLIPRAFERAASGGDMSNPPLLDWFAFEGIAASTIPLKWAENALQVMNSLAAQWSNGDRMQLLQSMRNRVVMRRIYAWYCLLSLEVDPASLTPIQLGLGDYLPVEEWQRCLHAPQSQEDASAGNASSFRKQFRDFRSLVALDPELCQAWIKGAKLSNSNAERFKRRSRPLQISAPVELPPLT